MNNLTYKIPHTCWIAEWTTPEDGGYMIFGKYHEDLLVRFDKVHEIEGCRCIAPIQEVRGHVVVDTWLECSEGETEKKTKLMKTSYFKRLVKSAIVNAESV